MRLHSSAVQPASSELRHIAPLSRRLMWALARRPVAGQSVVLHSAPPMAPSADAADLDFLRRLREAGL